ncbi:hypothetical protein GCM10010299_15460 [Streptomyces tanashiensis]|nr:hypothetical protein GCM10010299_15460 [Streptomyces tanashiensis]
MVKGRSRGVFCDGSDYLSVLIDPRRSTVEHALPQRARAAERGADEDGEEERRGEETGRQRGGPARGRGRTPETAVRPCRLLPGDSIPS